MSDTILSDSNEAVADRRAFRWVILATLGVCGYLLAWSIGSQPMLGDESQHHRRAFVYYDTGFPQHRVTHDPAYPADGYATIRYYDSGLWHMGLALLWRAIGRPSFLVAEVYHLAYFFALAVFSYLTGRELYGRRGGWWAWALTVTTPMNVLFGTVFYLEVPVLAFAAAAVYFLVRRRAVLTGIALAGMFLTKASSATVLGVPLIAANLLKPGSTWPRRILGTAVLLGVMGLAMAPDIEWRQEHFGKALMFRDTTVPLAFSLTYPIGLPKQSAVPLSILNPMVDLQMFGVTGILATLASLGTAVWLVCRAVWRTFGRWRTSGLRAAVGSLPETCGTEALVLAVPLLFYVTAFVVLLHRACDVRYFQPVMIFTAILGGGLLARRRVLTYQGRGRYHVRAAAWLLVLAMVGQGLTVPPYTRHRRTAPPEVLKAFAWIRKHTPERARFLYLETNLVNLTGRPLIWAAAMPRYLFQVPEREQMRVLYYHGVDYIAIHPTRQTDTFDPDVEPTAYPKAWVRSLAGRPYLTRVYPEGDLATTDGRFLVYRIDVDRIPKEWFEGVSPEASIAAGRTASRRAPPEPVKTEGAETAEATPRGRK